MDPFETMTAMGRLWGRNAQSLMDAQRNMMNGMNTAMPDPLAVPDVAALQAAHASFTKAWATAQEIASNLNDGLRAAGQAAQGGSDPIAATVLSKVFDPRGWLSASNEIDDALNRMAQGPQFADLWAHERKFASLFAAWIALRRRNLEHNAVMLEAWASATGAFAKALNARAEAGQPLESARALMTLWIETANDALLEIQRSDAFLNSQRETLKATTDLRLAQQEIAEIYAELYGAPSRAEIDDVHRSLTEMRRELRALKRAERTRRTGEAETSADPSGAGAGGKTEKPARRGRPKVSTGRTTR